MLESSYLIYGAIFLCALLLVEGIYYLVNDNVGRTSKVNRRMQLLDAGQTNREVYETLLRRTPDSVSMFGPAGSLYGWFDQLVMQAGVSIATARILLFMVGLAVFTFICVLVFARATFIPSVMPLPVAAGIAGVLIGFGGPILQLKAMRDGRIKKFSEQLPDALDVMVRSLKAGHPVSAAMNLVTREMPDPIGTEFGIAVDEMTYGLDLRDALENLGDRVKVKDFQYVVVSISIQHDTGGNLAEVLAGLSRVIRDRYKLFRKVRALSGEGRMSAVVLSVLPFGTFTIIFSLSPQYYTKVFGDPLFLPIAGGSLGMMVIGIMIMYRMVNFRV
jgi:tight adherence protein B